MGKVRADELEELACLYGVQTEYLDVSGRRQPASPESLLGVLGALGAPVAGEADVADALRERRHSRETRRVEPVNVAWEGGPAGIPLRLRESEASAKIAFLLTLEGGEERRWTSPLDRHGSGELVESESVRVVTRLLPMPAGLPSGYHRLRIEIGDDEAETLVISAPSKVYAGVGGRGERHWGLFCPLHALHRQSSWGAGDFSDLEALMEWAARQGAGLVATLPLLASSFDDSPMISPYSPTSRLFWNEFYLDLARIPELARCAGARALMESPGFRREIEGLRSDPLVHYGRQMRLKRGVLELLAGWFFENEAVRSTDFGEFIRDNPDVQNYARFMATGERGAAVRPVESTESPRDLEDDERARRYHLFAQWQADRQLRGLSRDAKALGLTWYVDFPVGVSASSYDVWRYPHAFATGASVGCPPDSVFTKGQDWGFPPPHPERQRERHYDYLIASLRCHFRHANALRIDHVMGLHRLYWIPSGEDARTGAYVNYPAEEVYAILSVESHRRGAWLVGENLGTVPEEVNRSLEGHGVHGMYVVQYEVPPDHDLPLREVPEAVVASVNTHDMPPFAAFWNGDDIGDRLDLGLFDASMMHREEEARQAQRLSLQTFLRDTGLLEDGERSPEAIIRACHEFLAGSPAHVVLLNIEDLWMETHPQNTPNTWDERPNWRRKVRHRFEDFREMPAILEALKRVADRRRAGSPFASPNRDEVKDEGP